MSKVQSYSPYSTFFPVNLVIVIVLVLSLLTTVTARKPHLINFRSPNLYPEGLTWDPLSKNFLVGSLHQRTIKSISKTGVVQNLIFDPTLPENTTILGVTVDSIHNHLLAVIQSIPPLPPFNAIVAYDLHLRKQIFLSILPSLNHNATARDAANDVTTDHSGNAYVTNSAGNFIWKVDTNGEASIFSVSSLYTEYLSIVDHSKPFSGCGLNGITYIKDEGYLLVVQSNTGKLFKVDVEDGTAKLVTLTRDLPWGDGIAVRTDGIVLVVSQHRLWWLKSFDEWGKGIVYEESEVKVEGFGTSVVVGEEEKIYVLYGHVIEGILGNNKDVVGREEFSIEEVRKKNKNEEKLVWVILLLGLGLANLFVS